MALNLKASAETAKAFPTNLFRLCGFLSCDHVFQFFFLTLQFSQGYRSGHRTGSRLLHSQELLFPFGHEFITENTSDNADT